MTNPINPMENSRVDQADFLQLFMQELTYQDPLKPIDNREFMAQMAQFSSLQETRNTNELLGTLLSLTSANQSLDLLGKVVRLKESNKSTKVVSVTFKDNEPPVLGVSEFPGKPVGLGDISEVTI